MSLSTEQREAELARREAELARREAEAELARKEAQAEAGRREAEAELERRQTEAELMRREAEIELARREAELDLVRRQAGVEAERHKAEAELNRRRAEADVMRTGSSSRPSTARSTPYSRTTQSSSRYEYEEMSDTLAEVAERTADQLGRLAGAVTSAYVAQVQTATELLGAATAAWWPQPTARSRAPRSSRGAEFEDPGRIRVRTSTRNLVGGITDAMNRGLDAQEDAIDRFYRSYKGDR